MSNPTYKVKHVEKAPAHQRISGIAQPPALTSCDEAALDRAWEKVSQALDEGKVRMPTKPTTPFKPPRLREKVPA